MSLFAEFHVPSDVFALYRTLQAAPETTVEIERVVAAEEILTPYFWVSGGDLARFETAIEDDPTVENLQQLDEFDRATLYRANWTENVETIVYAYTQVGATILEATGAGDRWELQMRFDDRDRLDQFQTYCNDETIPFQLIQLHELTQPRTGRQYGLTRKQHDALVTAWQLNYFTSTDVSLTDVAAELGISQQSLSQRLHRGYQSLIEETLIVSPPAEEGT
ncbi:bacterio-opsin activator domain-containing protein [Halosolutus amylolyticus]|uniref:Bacterio-opsin activator domain-containing protein n=1 Tax=Halosolutus amylolyticus TaxID=2932267 RepID=A0ABD5PTN9_9EURY|nr:bacterio-opsin activator domain-containing protein [Halosolutus amylolyticus]